MSNKDRARWGQTPRAVDRHVSGQEDFWLARSIEETHDCVGGQMNSSNIRCLLDHPDFPRYQRILARFAHSGKILNGKSIQTLQTELLTITTDIRMSVESQIGCNLSTPEWLAASRFTRKTNRG